MKKISGKYNTATVYTDNLEEKAEKQIELLCNQEFVQKSKLCIMPDVHAGAGCTIGTTMTIQDKIVPNLVGVDIGCGMEVIRIDNKAVDLEQLDRMIHELIPAGFNTREKEHPYAERVTIDDLRCEAKLDRAYKSIGTLGGGNHFIELNQDDDGHVYLVIHSGSRHLGLEVAEYYQRLGYECLNGNSKADIKELIAAYKAAGRDKEIALAIQTAKAESHTDIPKDLAYVENENFYDYIHDMKITQDFAMWNRKAMADEIVQAMHFDVVEQFTTIHNYIDTDNMILRKGAISAQKDEKMVIPMNMRDGSLICIGKGNPEWNYSAPHGAGRTMSRTAARKQLNLTDFKSEMEGIYSSTVTQDTIDEAPDAYKPMEDIIANIGDTVSIERHIKPIYNFKATE